MRSQRAHLAAITRPAPAQSTLVIILDNLANLMATIVIRQRQSAWKTPFPQFIFDPDDTNGGGE